MKKKSGIKVIEVKPRLGNTKPLTIGDLLARELKRVDKLGREAERARKKFTRSKMRYSVLKRLADSQSKED